jgi:hypothetical protein
VGNTGRTLGIDGNYGMVATCNLLLADSTGQSAFGIPHSPGGETRRWNEMMPLPPQLQKLLTQGGNLQRGGRSAEP